MAITYRTISALATRSTAGSLVPAEPTGTTTNDLLVAIFSFRGAGAPDVPSIWNVVNRTTVTGNTATNATSVGSGLMAWTKRGSSALTVSERTFGGVTAFPNLAFGYILRFDGQDLTNPVAGTSVNTLATGASGTVTTGGYTRTYETDVANDYIELMLCMGGQEVTWSTQRYITGSVAMTELVTDTTSTAAADGSIAVARSTTVGDTTGGFSAVTSAISARHSIMVASFGGPRPPGLPSSFTFMV